MHYATEQVCARPTAVTSCDEPRCIELVRYEDELEGPSFVLESRVCLPIDAELLFAIRSDAPLHADQRSPSRVRDHSKIHSALFLSPRWWPEPRQVAQQRPCSHLQSRSGWDLLDNRSGNVFGALADSVAALVLLRGVVADRACEFRDGFPIWFTAGPRSEPLENERLELGVVSRGREVSKSLSLTHCYLSALSLEAHGSLGQPFRSLSKQPVDLDGEPIRRGSE